MFRKFKIILALICLATFCIAAVASPFEDFPSDFLTRSIYKIKNPSSSHSKAKPVKYIAAFFSQSSIPELTGFKKILCIHEKGDSDSFHCSLSNRAPPSHPDLPV